MPALRFESLERRVVLTGTWSAVANGIPGGNGVGTMLLLSDGSVMAHEGNDAISRNWYKLTPDSSGSYANGTWTTLATMNSQRLFYGSAVLPDGRVFVVGGEYTLPGAPATESNTGEIYDPIADTWTPIATAPVNQVGDASCEVLADGNVLVGPVQSKQTYIYNVASDSWSEGATLPHGDINAEETWVKLSDGSILSYANSGFSSGQGQRYVPDPGGDHSLDTWVDAGDVPVRLESKGGAMNIVPEIGGAVRLADGRVFYAGASGNTALYSPPVTADGTGSWVAGPQLYDASNNLIGSLDAPAAVEPNGKVLVAASPINANTFPGPTTLEEYDPVTGTMTIVPNTDGPDLSRGALVFRMLALPSGQILVSSAAPGGGGLKLYTPDSPQVAGVAPTITDIRDVGSGKFTLTGTQLNGFSEGASYGDDAQMATNYPIVRLFDGHGHQYYARTSNWSSVGVGTGSTPATVDFKVPDGLPAGTYGLQVIASGVASSATTAARRTCSVPFASTTRRSPPRCRSSTPPTRSAARSPSTPTTRRRTAAGASSTGSHPPTSPTRISTSRMSRSPTELATTSRMCSPRTRAAPRRSTASRGTTPSPWATAR